MPTTAPATLPASDATPLATFVAPVTSELAGPFAFEDLAAPAEPAREILPPLASVLEADFGAVLDAAPDVDLDAAFGLAAPAVFGALGEAAAFLALGAAFMAAVSSFASFDRSAIAAPAPALIFVAFAPEDFFEEAALLI